MRTSSPSSSSSCSSSDKELQWCELKQDRVLAERPSSTKASKTKSPPAHRVQTRCALPPKSPQDFQRTGTNKKFENNQQTFGKQKRKKPAQGTVGKISSRSAKKAKTTQQTPKGSNKELKNVTKEKSPKLTKADEEVKIVSEERLFAEKYVKRCQELRDEGREFDERDLKPGCRIKDHRIEMQCVGPCQEWLPRTTRFFDRREKNFDQSGPGHESLCNSQSHPCKKCFARISSDRHATPDGYKTNLVNNYPDLGGLDWLNAQLERQRGVGKMTGIEMSLVPNSDWRMSIHNMHPGQPHTPENCVLDVLEFNAQQGNAIPNLPKVLSVLFNGFVEEFDASPLSGENWRAELKLTPADLGIKSQSTNKKLYNQKCRNRHLRTVLREMIRTNHRDDFRNRKFKANWTPMSRGTRNSLIAAAVEKIISQGCRCAYSHVPLSWENGWTRLSMDRQNNNEAHFQHGDLRNIKFICRLMNTRGNMSRKKMLELMLKLPPSTAEVPIQMRCAINTELLEIEAREGSEPIE